MKEFTKYNSLTLIHENRPDEAINHSVLVGDTRCVVLEKVHGSNLTAMYDGTTFQLARRNGVLDPSEYGSFYGVSYVADVIKERVVEMFDDIKTMTKIQHDAAVALEADGNPAEFPEIPYDFDTLTVRMEFAGGHYPHPDVVKCNVGHGQVGKGGIWYGQDKSVFAFAIEIDDKVLPFYDTMALLRSYNIPLAPVLYFGSLEQCMHYSKANLDSNTVIPLMQPLLKDDATVDLDDDGNLKHLPEIEGNIREGHVIMPVEPMYRDDGRAIIFKHKGDKWAESAKKPKDSKGTKKDSDRKVTDGFTESQLAVFDTAKLMLTVNRLNSVESKEIPFEVKDFRKACGLVVQDAIQEALETCSKFPVDWMALKTNERKQVTKALQFECCTALRGVFFK